MDNLELGYLVLKWDAINEDKGKHGKFDHLWLGPFKIAAYRGRNAYLLQESNGELAGGGTLNAGSSNITLFEKSLPLQFIVYNRFVFFSLHMKQLE